MIRLFFLAFAFLGGAASFAQIPTFKVRHGTSANDEARFVTVLPDNSFIVAGNSAGGGLGGTDAMLVKFSGNGTVEWSKAYGGSSNDFFNYILVCSDGHFIALGETNSFGAGNVDIYVVKFDINGNIIWERTCGGSGIETGRGISEASDGYIISGGTQSFGGGFWDVYVEKLDFDGNSQWNRAWGTGGGDIAGYTLTDVDGDIWVSGFWFLSGANHDAILFRLNSNGVLQNAIRPAVPNNDNTMCLLTGGAGMVAAGTSYSYTNGATAHPWIISYNTSGDFVWAKRYPIPGGSFEMVIENCPDGGFVFAPIHMTADINLAYLVKTNDSGDVIWSKSYLYGGNGRMYHAQPCPDGGYVAVGYCSGAGRDMFIIKTNAEGNILNCCPEDAGIVAIAVSPPTPSLSSNSSSGAGAITSNSQNQTVNLTETSLCSGPSCCPTEAGTMLAETLTICANQPAGFTHNGDEILEPNDLLQFILYTNPANPLGSIVAIGNTPVFAFDPATMQAGTTYYVAAIAGDNVGGNVNLNDPCLDLSNAAQLAWRALPEVSFVIDNADVCPGNCRTVTATLTGTPPFVLTVNNPVTGDFTVTFSSNTGSFQICPPPGTPPGSFTVQAVLLTDAFCTCP